MGLFYISQKFSEFKSTKTESYSVIYLPLLYNLHQEGIEKYKARDKSSQSKNVKNYS